MEHVSVLLEECIDGLNIKPDKKYIDCTLGRAGHSKKILEKITNGKLYCFDKDQEAITKGTDILKSINNNFEIIKSDFKDVKAKVSEKVDGILFDLGVSSPQFDDKDRGFSYRFDARLDMRMDKDQAVSAINVVNEYSVKDLIRIFKEYGDEKFASKIANNIIKTREQKQIETTFELVDIIKQSIPMKFQRKKHPAKKVFQAIRIEVNGELKNLEQTMFDAASMLNSKGRLVVITFHSGEDRIVKNVFNKLTEVKKDFNNPLPDDAVADYIKVTKKPLIATEKEQDINPRSRSAKLRIIERR